MIPAWMPDSLCQHFATLPWIAEPRDRSPAVEAAMRVVCLACPVRVACNEYAARPAITGGFWAGLDRTLPRDATAANEVA